MEISGQGLELVKRHEGCSLDAYRCPAGVWTIGYGHTDGVRLGQRITAQEAEECLRRDLKVAQSCINASVKRPLSQGQYDALVSFCFNVGCGAFLRSTLLRMVKADPSDVLIRDEFLKWNRAGVKVLDGLTARRREEADMYFNG